MKNSKILVIGALLLASVSSFATQNPYLATIMPPKINAKSYLLIDVNSEFVLAEENSTNLVEPASLTKMMTMYVIDHEIKNGKLRVDDDVTISTKAWRAPGSRMFVEVGSTLKVAELIKGIIIHSGNDASIAMAEHVAGSEEAFAELMNYYAKILGMNDTHFTNATGLPDPEHYTSAKDMATLAIRLIEDFPDSYKIYSEKEYTYHGIKQLNRNRLLWVNNHVDGIKTGQTDSAGYCLVASALNNGTRLVAVIMGASNDQVRTSETNKLINWGFRFYETKKILTAHETIHNLKIWLGKSSEVAVGSERDLYVTVPIGKFKKIATNIQSSSKLQAPVYKGDLIGTFVIKDEAGNILKEHPLISMHNVLEGNLWQKFKDKVVMSTNYILNKMND